MSKELSAGSIPSPNKPLKTLLGSNRQYPRVTVRLTGSIGKSVDDIMELTAAQNPSEVVRRAIAVYHTLLEQKIAGNEAYVELREASGIKKVPIFL